MEQLEALRRELDSIDEELIGVLARRLSLCAKIALFKRDNGVPMMQQHRIDHVKRRGAAMASRHQLNVDFVMKAYDLIIGEACRIEDELIGPRG